MSRYDPATISRFFDDYGVQEWERLEKTPQDRVSFFLHRHYLKAFITADMHVLEVGAGAGRFTIELARLGARVTVGDISHGQLELNERHVKEAGLEDKVVARDWLDVTDLSRFADASFDAVVCYGGPISYVMERADEALAELLRVVRPGAPLLLSVMSKVGATRIFLPGVLEITRDKGTDFVNQVLESGLLTAEENKGHAMKMYSWRELEALFARHPCAVMAASAANHLSTMYPEVLTELEPELWAHLLDWELRLCREPGALDGGTHTIAVLKKR